MRIAEAYDAESFRALGHRTVDKLADYLAAMRAGEGKVVSSSPAPRVAASYPPEFAHEGGADVDALFDRVIEESVHQHHPRYVGHQVSAPAPLAAVSDFVAALLNNGMAAFEAGPVSTAMEVACVSWLAAQLGWPREASGVLTSGGTLGNVTALLAARNFARVAPGERVAVITSAESHYCIQRAAQVLGVGEDAVVKVPSDERFTMQPEALSRAIAAAREDGRRVFAVVATAGSTSTGSFDPLGPIADVCKMHGLWLHVDGAHGASVALSARYRGLVEGIERADSVVWDAHKLLAMPALVTAVIFRDPARSYGVFAQDVAYLFATTDPDARDFDMGLRTMECTKRMMSLKLYASLAALGPAFFDELVTSRIDLARAFAEELRARGTFDVPLEPSCNIVCFRLRLEGEDDDAQDAIRAAVHASGGFFLTRTRLRGRVYLRVALMNPLTTLADLVALADAITAARVAHERDRSSR